MRMDNVTWEVEPYKQCKNSFWEAWEKLFKLYHAHNPMLDVNFIKALIEFFPCNMFVAFGRVNGDVVGILLLEKINFGRWKNYKPSQLQLVPLLLSPIVRFNVKGLMKAIPHLCLQLDFYGIDPEEHGPLLNEVKKYSQFTMITNVEIRVDKPFLSYWHQRSKNLQKNIKKVNKKLLNESIKSQLVNYTTEKDVATKTDIYGLIESKGWKGKLGTSLHPSNLQGQFYRKVMESFAVNRKSIVFEYQLNGEVVASRLCIQTNDKLIILKTTFNEKYKKYAVGRMLLYGMIEYIFEHKLVKSIDFYTNANEDQIKWSTHSREQINISIFYYDFVDHIVNYIYLFRKYIKSYL